MPSVMPKKDRHELASAIGDGDMKKFMGFLKKYPDLALGPIVSDISGETWLHAVAQSGQLAICQKLIEHGADVNATDISCDSRSIDSALKYAVSGDHTAVVKLLLENGATIDPNDKWLVVSAIANDHEDLVGPRFLYQGL